MEKMILLVVLFSFLNHLAQSQNSCSLCTCSKDFTAAFCNDLNLVTIPANLPKSIISLNVQNNNIIYINVYSLLINYPNLLYFNIKDNPLTHSGCSELREANRKREVC